MPTKAWVGRLSEPTSARRADLTGAPSARSADLPDWLRIALLVALALTLRLYYVGAPPIGVHSWRQADTASIARNYHRGGYEFLRPQIDWAGDAPGYVETEFPLYPFIVAIVYAATGPEVWAARLISAIAGAATVFFLYRLVSLTAGRPLAGWAALLFAILPLCVYYGRTIQPESLMLCASAAGIYYTALWSRDGRARCLALSWVCITLACLLKLPALYLGLPIAWLCWRRHGVRAAARPELWAYAAALFAAVGAWYAYSYHLGRASGASFAILGSDKFGRWDLLLDPGFYNIIIFRRLAERHLTWIGFALFAIGLFLKRRSPDERLFDVWMLAVAVYFLIAPFPNQVHEYYQLPFLLPAVVPVARGLEAARQRSRILAAALLIAIAAMSAFRIYDYGRREDPAASPEVEAARAVARATSPADLVIAVDGKLPTNPTLLYLADRKGWALPPSALDAAALSDLHSRGATHLFGAVPFLWSDEDRRWFERAAAEHRLVHSSPAAFVIELRPRQPDGSGP